MWWYGSQCSAPEGLTHPSLVACLFSKLLCLWENLPTRPRQTHLSRVSLCLILYAFDLPRLISARGWQLYLVVKAWETSGPGVSKTTAPPYMPESGPESLRADWCSLGLWACCRWEGRAVPGRSDLLSPCTFCHPVIMQGKLQHGTSSQGHSIGC